MILYLSIECLSFKKKKIVCLAVFLCYVVVPKYSQKNDAVLIGIYIQQYFMGCTDSDCFNKVHWCLFTS